MKGTSRRGIDTYLCGVERTHLESWKFLFDGTPCARKLARTVWSGGKRRVQTKRYLSLSLEITEALVRSGAVDIVVIDSVAALVPRAEIEGEMGDTHVGLQARLMSQALRKLTGVVGKTKCLVIFINQIREKVGIMFGNPEVRFEASLL